MRSLYAFRARNPLKRIVTSADVYTGLETLQHFILQTSIRNWKACMNLMCSSCSTSSHIIVDVLQHVSLQLVHYIDLYFTVIFLTMILFWNVALTSQRSLLPSSSGRSGP
jgi:hypothetical protein